MSSKPVLPDATGSNPSSKPDLRIVSQDGADESADAQLKSILCDVLGIERDDAAELDEQSGLFGHMPELDSMAVAGLLTEIEDRFDIVIEDEDVDGEMLETYGGLLAFVESKIEETKAS